MNIGLIADNTASFPNLPLMKISAYHKAKGDNVELAQSALFQHYDIVYVSRTFNLDLPTVPKIDLDYIDADKFIYGGSGFSLEVKNGVEICNPEQDKSLPYEIEHIYPDYSLYPKLTQNKAFGFLTRGCPNCCPFCTVWKREGKRSVKVADLSEWWKDQKNIVLLDGNILACNEREDLIMQLADSGANIDYTQGLDARFIDNDIAKLICQTKVAMVHFAFDLMKNEKAIINGLKIFKKYFNKSDRYCKVYILTNFNTSFEEDFYRVKKVIELGYRPDIRIYQKNTAPQITRDLARWANNAYIFRSCAFEDYIPRKDGKTAKQLYNL